ncbi:MAG: type II toxin-antitoxin system RelB/DinJ family antitoxin [Candidatus Kerfeldbacteria bacterium]|nr:type II toxin-antitoxin system RelB/DinJ family antitoxin [Candidatus Kerfeldbacteria bacterium]
MNTAIINIKTDPKVKQQAQKVAEDLGLSLSTVINGYLKQFVRNRSFQVSLYGIEEPSDYLIQALQTAQADEADGWVSPTFTNLHAMTTWLNNPERIYKNGSRG